MASQKIGRYEIERKLGEGGMASVHLARDPLMKRQVAIKVLPRELTDDSQFRARFRREAEIVARLEHPHIVPVYDLGEHKGQPFIVMRYMNGGSLSERVKRGRLPLAETARIVSALASALDYAHGKGIIHRDLKPANIMFDGEGQPFISDFGIAKLAEATTHLTGTGIIGTPMYMSPEQWRGDQSLDARSDVYALGVMTFEMLSGRAPFEASTPAQIMYRHLMDAPPRLADVIPGLPAECNAIIERAMAKEPGARFTSAGEMANALTALAPPPVGESPPTIAPEPPPPPQPMEKKAATPKPVVAKVARPAQPKPAKLSEGDLRPTGVIIEKPKRSWMPFVIAAVALVIVTLIAGGGAMLVTARSGATPTQIALATDTPQPAATRAPTSIVIAQPTQELPSTTPAPDTATPAPTLGIGSTKVSGKDGMVQMYVPAGEFLMGASDSDTVANTDEKPQHTVYLDSFWIDKTEVTNAMYELCVDVGQCAPPSSVSTFGRATYFGDPRYDDYPVVNVAWTDAKNYCEWMGRHLPTEAQWEKAARGADGHIYPWGNGVPDPTLLNFASSIGDTTAVGRYPKGASPYGAFDMAGNVWEWVADWYDSSYYSNSPSDNPQGPQSGDYHLWRGGHWGNDANDARATTRCWLGPVTRCAVVGFRCAQSATDSAVTSEATPVLAIGSTQISSKDGMVQMYVPEGEFLMGSNVGFPNERPEHKVTLDAFWIDQTEVTKQSFAVFLTELLVKEQLSIGADGRVRMNGKALALLSGLHQEGNTIVPDEGLSDHPANSVEWYGAQAYCGWGGRRLPTEAEWEKAARGTDGRKYPWGNTDPSAQLLNYNQNTGTTTVVGSFPKGASPYGALDMAGNVRELVSDWYDPDYYSISPAVNPKGPSEGQTRLAKDGPWFVGLLYVRSSLRFEVPEPPGSDVGFRCAQSATGSAVTTEATPKETSVTQTSATTPTDTPKPSATTVSTRYISLNAFFNGGACVSGPVSARRFIFTFGFNVPTEEEALSMLAVGPSLTANGLPAQLVNAPTTASQSEYGWGTAGGRMSIELDAGDYTIAWNWGGKASDSCTLTVVNP